MKIAFLSSFAHLVLDPAEQRTSGGAELQVALLARELSRRGPDVVLLGGNTGQSDGVLRQGVRVRNAGNFHTGKNAQMLASLPRVVRVLREEKADWVCVLGWTAWLFVLWLLRKPLRFRLAYICGLDTEVNGEFRRENPLRGALFEFAMRRCDARFAMTELQRSIFLQKGMTCSIYRNLILPRNSPPPERHEKSTDFLWVARCREIKRPLLFLELARTLPEARMEMICPPEDASLFARVQEAAEGLQNLRLSTGVPYHEIQKRYDATRIFVNTSDWEGWANSFIQAGQGRAALLSLRVRPERLFDEYQLGFCATGDWGLFVRKAKELWLSPEQTWRMGLEAERFVHELHDNQKETTAFFDGLRSAEQK